MSITKKVNRSKLQKLIDFIFFPLRALFINEENIIGLTSLREERFENVAKFCNGRVLDIGCGRNNLFIKTWLKTENNIGIDIFPYEGVENIVSDMTHLPYEDSMFDTVTLIAVGGHIPQKRRVSEFNEISRVLKLGGQLIMTEGEPVSQTIDHIWRHYSLAMVGKKGMDHERGMEHDEQYCMPKKELLKYLNTPPLRLIKRKRFMWGLNNVYVAIKVNLS